MLKRRIITACIIAAAAVFASFYGGGARTLFYISLLIPIFSAVYTFYVYMRFRIYQDAENKIIVKGEKTPYYFVLSDEYFLAFTDIRVECYDDFSTVQNIELSRSYCLMPGEKYEYHTEILCRYRGEYNVGVKRLIITDPLGIMKIRYPAPCTISMSVLPKITEIETMSIAELNDDAKLVRFSHSSSNEPPDCETRKYVQGDSIKLMNWKVSAKKRDFYVRQSSDSPDCGIMLIMDMTPVDGDDYTRIITEDHIIECALTTANYLVRKNVPVTIAYEQGELNTDQIDSPVQLRAFYEKCAAFKFCGTYSAADIGRTLPVSLMNGLVIFAVSSLTEELIEICENILRLDGQAAVILASQTGIELSRMLDNRVIFRHISLNDEVSDILGGTNEH